MTTVACVYGSGGEFNSFHVNRWVDMVRRHVPTGTKLACLTDRPGEIASLVDIVWSFTPEELAWGWRGGWPKIALLKQLGPILYLDLDVNVVGRLEPFMAVATNFDWVMCKDFWKVHPPLANSSVMAWCGDAWGLYGRFAADPAAGKRCDGSVAERHWTEQMWLLQNAKWTIRWQDLLPGMVLSYKNEVLRGADTSRARIIVSHSWPRPWQEGGADRIGRVRHGDTAA